MSDKMPSKIWIERAQNTWSNYLMSEVEQPNATAYIRIARTQPAATMSDMAERIEELEEANSRMRTCLISFDEFLAEDDSEDAMNMKADITAALSKKQEPDRED